MHSRRLRVGPATPPLPCRRGLVAAAAWALVPTTAAAWGPDGHRLVAHHAQVRLSTPARVEVERLLALEPGASLASISMWADETRSLATGAWHYVNFWRDAGCRYDAPRMCVEGYCIVAALEAQLAVLRSTAPDEERLRALKYVVHLTADAYQPLHGGFGHDRGGNTVALQAAGAPTNLHALWDGGLIEQWPGGLPALRAAIDGERPAGAGGGPGVVAAVEESCAIVAAEGFYPDGREVDARYLQRWGSTLVRRLAAAGRRLAELLDAALGERR